MRSDFLARIALVIALCTHHTYALPLLRADGQAEVLSNVCLLAILRTCLIAIW